MSAEAPVADKDASTPTKAPKPVNPNREILGELKKSLKTPRDGAEHASAMTKLEELATAGDLVAKRILAGALAKSEKPEDQARAFALFKEAGDLGDPEALFAIARAISKGQLGQMADEAKAADVLKLAADAGHPRSQYIALKGMMPGKAGEGDVPGAWKLYKSGYNKHPGSHTLMARQLESGKRIPQDRERAANLYRRAAEKGDADAAFRLYQLYANPKRKIGGPTEAFDALQLATRLGHPEAGLELAKGMEAGAFGAVAPAETAATYERAALAGASVAKLWLGRAFATGAPGVPTDLERAKFWLQAAADDGVEGAVAELAKLGA